MVYFTAIAREMRKMRPVFTSLMQRFEFDYKPVLNAFTSSNLSSWIEIHHKLN